jgi:hypothetical protein
LHDGECGGGEHFDVDGGQHAGVLRNNGSGCAVAGAQTPPICVSESQLDQTTKGMHISGDERGREDLA